MSLEDEEEEKKERRKRETKQKNEMKQTKKWAKLKCKLALEKRRICRFQCKSIGGNNLATLSCKRVLKSNSKSNLKSKV